MNLDEKLAAVDGPLPTVAAVTSEPVFGLAPCLHATFATSHALSSISSLNTVTSPPLSVHSRHWP